MQLSEKLRLLSARLGYTQEALGAELGIAQTTVGRWLAGKSRPYDRHAIRLAELLRVPVATLLDDAKPLPPDWAMRLKERNGAAAAVAEKYVEQNPDLAQAVFEAEIATRQHNQDLKDFAEELRAKAAELIAWADRIDPPEGVKVAGVSYSADRVAKARQRVRDLAAAKAAAGGATEQSA